MHPFVTKTILLLLSIGLVVYWLLEWAAKWVIKKAQSLVPWLKFLLHCLVVLSLEAVRFIVVHGIEYAVFPALLLLVRVIVYTGIYLIFFNFNSPKFLTYIKVTEEEEKKNEIDAAVQLGDFSYLWHLGELLSLLGLLLELGYLCTIYLFSVVSPTLKINTLTVLTIIRRKIHAWAADNGNEGEQGADYQEPAMPPSTSNNNNNMTTTTGMASASDKVGLLARIRRLLTPKKATATPHRPRFALRNPFKGMTSKQGRARLSSSAATHEQPTPTASNATMEMNRARSESGLMAWARRATRAESVSVGLVRLGSQSQEVGKKGEGEAGWVADAC